METARRCARRPNERMKPPPAPPPPKRRARGGWRRGFAPPVSHALHAAFGRSAFATDWRSLCAVLGDL